MTTQKLSSEKLIDTSLLKNLMRRRLPHILVAFLANFFTIAVPFMLWMSDLKERLISGTYTLERYYERAADNVQQTMAINLVFMFILGIYFGLITLGFIMKRRSAHFYHALPQNRDTLYTTSLVSALVCALIGGAAAVVIALIQLVANAFFTSTILVTFFILLAKNIIYFLVAYAITVFAGSFSGNGLVQTLMSLVIMFYPVATYAGVALMRSISSTYFWESFYFDSKILRWLSPVFYASYEYWGTLKIIPTIIALLVVAALILGGMAIYRKRAIENSERPIVFKKLGTVLKYMLMFTVTIYAGAFFYALGEDYFEMLFGFLCGAVLSWMLFNTILAKSPKAMFRGVKGFVIFLAAFGIFASVTCFDVFNIDDYVPAEDNISFADIEVGNATYNDTRFKDPEILAALSTLLQNQREADEKGINDGYSGGVRNFRISTVMYTKLGIPIARNYYVSKYTQGAEEFLKLYADDERMEAKFSELKYALGDIAQNHYTASVHTSHSGYEKYDARDLALLCETYVRELGTVNYDRVSMPVVEDIELYDIYDSTGKEYFSLYEKYDLDYSMTELPVYADMTDTITLLGVEPRAPEVVWEDDNGVVQNVELSGACIVDTRDLESGQKPIKISTELGEELALLLMQYNDTYCTFSRVFTAIDTDCFVELYYGEASEKYTDYEQTYGYEYGGVIVETKAYYDPYEAFTFFFPKGYVPDSVKALLK